MEVFLTSFRVKSRFTNGRTNIMPSNPNRKDDYSLALLYTHENMPQYKDAENQAQLAGEFPGQHNHVDFH